MNPVKIGDSKQDQPNPDPENETALIHQEYLLNRSLTINDYLQETESQILDFTRFEIGEVIEGQQNLDAVETGG
jgi:translation elongation factor EF-Ts